MSTTVITQPAASPHRASRSLRERSLPFALVTLFTVLAFVVHGYHPYSEDGGIYATGIKWLLHPSLYPHSLPFVQAHLHFSLFAPLVAALVPLTHLSLDVALLLLQLISIWTTLFAIWLLAKRCYVSPTAQAGAVLLTAAWLTVPVAGTSLILVDPYVTARSVSLPCTLLALIATLDLARPGKRARAMVLCAIALAFAAVIHPLMAAYALGDVLLLAAITSPHRIVRRWGTIALCLIAVVFAAMLQVLAPRDTAAYTRIAYTRYYWFLSQWHWYELFGLIAPLLILAVVAFFQREVPSARQALAKMAVASGVTATFVSICFAHETSAVHIVARLQPLRLFQTIYLLMILVLGAALGQHVLRRSLWRWITAFALLGGIFFFVQRDTYSSSAHIEWPGAIPVNQWEQAFLWIRDNTPTDALFAMDANYISLHGEDAQTFRSLAERSALPDYSKDGGEASITPTLTGAWVTSQQAQTHLSQKTDAERLAALRPLAANWVVLQQQAQTGFDCPYQNDLVKVCRLP